MSERLEVYLQRRLEALEAQGDEAGAVRTRQRLALLQRQRPEGLEHLRLSLAYHRARGEWLACADLLLLSAERLLDLDHRSEAGLGLQQARALYLQQEDLVGLALSERLQARLHAHEGRAAEAVECLGRATRGLALGGLFEAAAWAALDASDLRHAMGEDRPAVEALEQAATFFEQAGKTAERATSLMLLSQRHHQRGRHEEALGVLQRLQPQEAALEPGARVRWKGLLGDAWAARGLLRQALRPWRQALELQQAGHVPDLAAQAELLLKMGRALANVSGPEDEAASGEVELMLGQAADLYIALGDARRMLEAADALVRWGQVRQDPELAGRWMARALEAAPPLLMRQLVAFARRHPPGSPL
jgi:tetratricopeptide (TPR) repeat protein